MSRKMERALARCPRTLGQIVADVFDRGGITRTGECWVWENESSEGYVKIGIASTSFPAHKIFYAYFMGDVEDGLMMDHLCRNHSCVNPWHLDPVTPLVNSRRGYLARGYAMKAVHKSDRLSLDLLDQFRSGAYNLIHQDVA